MSIAQNSHTHDPKMGISWCTQKDVILSRPMKLRVFCKKLVFWGGVVAKTACFFRLPTRNFNRCAATALFYGLTENHIFFGAPKKPIFGPSVWLLLAILSILREIDLHFVLGGWICSQQQDFKLHRHEFECRHTTSSATHTHTHSRHTHTHIRDTHTHTQFSVDTHTHRHTHTQRHTTISRRHTHSGRTHTQFSGSVCTFGPLFTNF